MFCEDDNVGKLGAQLLLAYRCKLSTLCALICVALNVLQMYFSLCWASCAHFAAIYQVWCWGGNEERAQTKHLVWAEFTYSIKGKYSWGWVAESPDPASPSKLSTQCSPISIIRKGERTGTAHKLLIGWKEELPFLLLAGYLPLPSRLQWLIGLLPSCHCFYTPGCHFA